MGIKFNQSIFWALAASGTGISGSDRIFIEFSKRWSKQFPVTIYTSPAGADMLKKQSAAGIANITVKIINVGLFSRWFIVDYIAKIFHGIFLALKISSLSDNTLIYSCSEFWMDSLPALILKLRFPGTIWAASWYQTAPNPIQGFSSGRYRLAAFYYWFMQLPVRPLISNYADYVMVNNQKEKNVFPQQNKRGQAVVVLGAVNTDEISNWIGTHKKELKIYDAVFQGRFHPQKGVVELIDIWKLVVQELPQAKLVMIGDGPLYNQVKQRIKDHHLENNVSLFGYVFDGNQKNSIFSKSKLVVHPSFYDSGGMASAEAMAFGLPAVTFDLPAYADYYPQGTVKAPLGDLQTYSKEIIELLANPKKAASIGQAAQKMINSYWSWHARADEVISQLQTLHEV